MRLARLVKWMLIAGPQLRALTVPEVDTPAHPETWVSAAAVPREGIHQKVLPAVRLARLAKWMPIEGPQLRAPT
eukprot:COSAG06_NODE_58779_length_276_cov_0.581921_1_plen_73_part_10